MVECGNQLDRFGQQHAVAKHIAGHIPAARNADAVFLDVNSLLKEMALDADPSAARGNAHRLVVISVGPTACKSIAKPESGLFRDTIGNVRETRCAFISCNHEIRIFAIANNHFLRMLHAIARQIICHRQKRADEDFITRLTFSGPASAVARGRWQLLGIKASLCSCRNDHRVFHALRFHQAQDLCAEIVAPVRPAQAAARNRPGTQVNAFDPSRIDEYFAPGDRFGQVRH